MALFDALGADAITANPYLGRDAIAPFLERRDRFVYVLCRTSNPGAADAPEPPHRRCRKRSAGEPLYVHVARTVAAWSEAGDQVGLVVGATAPTELAEIRAAAPALPFLVPGIGAQGGDVDAVLEHGPATAGRAATTRRRRAAGQRVARNRRAPRSNRPIRETRISQAAQGWATRLRC